jgi:hypothetical protein
MDKQGQTANKSGKGREEYIRNLIRERGVPIMTNAAYKKLKSKPEEVWITNPDYRSIYEHNGRSDGLLIRDSVPRLRLEQKNQNVAGSVDEKIPYMVENLREGKFPEPKVVFIVEGNGYKEGAVEWMEREVLKHNEMPGRIQEAYFYRDADLFMELFDEIRD